MDLNGKTIGIWGYGIGGKAIVKFLLKQSLKLMVFDQKQLADEDQIFLQQHNVEIVNELNDFLECSDYIFPSAGVDLRPFGAIKYKFLSELDLFQSFFHKPIIAITGTLGKTTVTTFLAKLLQNAGKRVAVGGNIGIGLCSLIEQQEMVDYAVLEVSSFQLELCETFAPAVAVWTNFYSNHLDRHDSVEDYFAAKTKIVSLQKENNISVVPSSLFLCIKERARFEHQWSIIPEQIPSDWLSYIPEKGVQENWKTLCAVLCALKIPLDVLKMPLDCVIEHRVEYVGSVCDRQFYNDSKSTVPEATISAVNQLRGSIILLLGGLSKGVSRELLISYLKDKVKHIICFGKEREQLAAWCVQYNMSHNQAVRLDEAVEMAYNYSSSGDIILLSPGGSSFDLFKNYQDRGNQFKGLITQLKG
ncbi:TPA: hypothetical protein DIC20_04295 [Candidatus Dependentiae bacterium]|nr:MAG: UDP-N-acetylmuramoylalanine-D-glutamate ligase [candidate division TM6 bacterium GW2011_GWF2_36_131]KKQ03220.1 MAG: UDP-N-acetylmuramoylalanine-D-glutamate ligase [candidate division TM6 bacterium GW2011_GWE2_36_25]KKQ18193.1 MAG: UDP-N-acetylmuramoylalanine-D-glutamate ligase [candidate division TM6 bacterium GW2011_GWA2_36_9]HBR70350.1 hypothetical protein [Candidatus Dependentiae bacterium]HCU00895.1 hypothetical protein [Candidatus Dependentiae bacterium]